MQQTPGSLNQTIDFGEVDIPIAVTVGDNFVCALLDNGTVKCFGSNESG
jgi:Regulator of chromosome condensation (RCC1) repeat